MQRESHSDMLRKWLEILPVHRESGDFSCFPVTHIDFLISQKVVLLKIGVNLHLKKYGGFSERVDRKILMKTWTWPHLGGFISRLLKIVNNQYRHHALVLREGT